MSLALARAKDLVLPRMKLKPPGGTKASCHEEHQDTLQTGKPSYFMIFLFEVTSQSHTYQGYAKFGQRHSQNRPWNGVRFHIGYHPKKIWVYHPAWSWHSYGVKLSSAQYICVTDDLKWLESSIGGFILGLGIANGKYLHPIVLKLVYKSSIPGLCQ